MVIFLAQRSGSTGLLRILTMITCSALMLILVLYLPKFVKWDYNLIYHIRICPPSLLGCKDKNILIYFRNIAYRTMPTRNMECKYWSSEFSDILSIFCQSMDSILIFYRHVNIITEKSIPCQHPFNVKIFGIKSLALIHVSCSSPSEEGAEHDWT